MGMRKADASPTNPRTFARGNNGWGEPVNALSPLLAILSSTLTWYALVWPVAGDPVG
jgi:hypothetical protein